MLGLLTAILPVFLVVGAGYLVVQQRLFPESAVDGLMLFAQSFAIPALLFGAMSTLDLSTLTASLFLSYYGGATAAFLVALTGAHLIFGRSWEDSIAIGFCALFANGMLLGVPVTQQVFGPDATRANFAIISVNSRRQATISGFLRKAGFRARVPARLQPEAGARDRQRNRMLTGSRGGTSI